MSKGFIAIIGMVIGIIVLLTVAFFLLQPKEVEPEPIAEVVPEVIEAPAPVWPERSVIGSSVEGRSIEAYRFGDGDTNLLFVGGIHGGYEWNSIALAYEMIDYLTNDTNRVPENLSISIIPNLNPDGLFLATGREGRITYDENLGTRMHADGIGRMNANGVDLNRNFACKWAPESTWRSQVVSAGTSAFSEPEAVALRDYVTSIAPDAVVFWHSQANNVYASECEDGVLPETLAVMETYASAAGYGEVPVFDAYPITGDAEGWLASLGIPAVTVELGSRTSIEWSRNLAGTEALIEYYSVAR